jgi:hypothetical protein
MDKIGDSIDKSDGFIDKNGESDDWLWVAGNIWQDGVSIHRRRERGRTHQAF